MRNEEWKTDSQDDEKRILSTLFELEDLAEKKARIYSRLLTQVTLAQEMEALADRHAQRRLKLESLLTGKKIQNEDTMSKTNSEGGES